jgi:hypothetical protein
VKTSGIQGIREPPPWVHGLRRCWTAYPIHQESEKGYYRKPSGYKKNRGC